MLERGAQSPHILYLLVDGCGDDDIVIHTSLRPDQVKEARATMLAERYTVSTTDDIQIGICAHYRRSNDEAHES